MLMVDAEFAELYRIAKMSGLSAEKRAAIIADRIKPPAANLQLRAGLRRKLAVVEVTPHLHLSASEAEALQILRRELQRSDHLNRLIPDLKLERHNGWAKYRDVKAFWADLADRPSLDTLIELILASSDEIILASVTPPWPVGFVGRELSRSDRQAVFAREVSE